MPYARKQLDCSGGADVVSGAKLLFGNASARRVFYAELPKAMVLCCLVRYFSDGAIWGSRECSRCYVGACKLGKKRRYPPKVKR
jgi:hypothetical protein